MSDVGMIYQQMAKVAAEIVAVGKEGSRNVSYKFRTVDAVMNALHEPLTRHGLFLSPRVLDDWRVQMIPGSNNREQVQVAFRVCIDVYAEDGSSVTLGPGMALAHDYGDKASYQAQQNAIKYLLIEAFSIPTDEPDMDGRQPDAVPAGQDGAASSGRSRPASTSSNGPTCDGCGESLAGASGVKVQDGQKYHAECAA